MWCFCTENLKSGDVCCLKSGDCSCLVMEGNGYTRIEVWYTYRIMGIYIPYCEKHMFSGFTAVVHSSVRFNTFVWQISPDQQMTGDTPYPTGSLNTTK
jgi:hypothetical protein